MKRWHRSCWPKRWSWGHFVILRWKNLLWKKFSLQRWGNTMHSFWIIFKQAFMTKARTKSFIITTVIVAAAFFLLANLPSIIESFAGDEEGQVLHVVDESGELVPQLQAQLEQADSNIQAMPTDLSESELRNGITEGTIEAYLVIEGEDALSARYVSESANEIGAGAEVENAVQAIQTALTA